MIVYSNSCSFGATQGHEVYADTVASSLGATVINNGEPGACNRRIIRTSLRDLVSLTNQDNVVFLLGLTFVSRTELWRPDLPALADDGHFHSLKIDHTKIDWSISGLIDTIVKDVHELADVKVRGYYKEWLSHYQPEAEVTQLLTDTLMLAGWCKAHSVKYAFFSNVDTLPSSPLVGYDAPFLSSLRASVESDPSIINPWDFSFGSYSLLNGHAPKDQDVYGVHGHPGEQAHIEFGQLLVSRLRSTYQDL